MVAFEMGSEYKRQNEMMEALRCFEEAERRFPMSEWKDKAREEAEDIRNQPEVVVRKPKSEPCRYDPEATLLIISCTKNKIWKEELDAPSYVPAQNAYLGKNFKKFLVMMKTSECKKFKWVILSAKYGYIEPLHPIGNYDVTFNDENTGPISDQTLYSQVMNQRRWDDTIPLKSFGYVICFGSPTYLEKVKKSFRDTGAQIIDGSTLEEFPKFFQNRARQKEKTATKDLRVRYLLEFGEKVRPRQLFPVLVEDAALLIENDPFAFALAAVLDRGTKSEIIWTIPYYLQKRLGNLSPYSLANKSIEELERIFRILPTRPRYITDAPRTVKELSEIVVREFGGDVSKIWQDKSSEYVKATFQRIYGVAHGIASMIVLLLERCFGVHFTDINHKDMDVKSDVHVVRVFHRLGLISEPDETEALTIARRLNPEYPGALDSPTWVIGKKWCTPVSPKCYECPLRKVCERAKN
jgi:endonuclease-3